MTGCIAILVAWAIVSFSIPWGVVDRPSCEECQIAADAMAKEQGIETELCIPYGPDQSMKVQDAMRLKTYKVKWIDAL